MATKINRHEARTMLETCGVPIGAEYYALRSAQVDALIAMADKYRYCKPRNANGSRSRYFHEMLQRKAAPFTRTMTGWKPA